MLVQAIGMRTIEETWYESQKNFKQSIPTEIIKAQPDIS